MQHEISLLDDHFSADEANEILLGIYKSKIQFHKIKNLSSTVRNGVSDEVAIKRIEDLNKSVEKLTEIIETAKQSKGKLVIKSALNISLFA
ncbi:MAG: hypothetical protein KGZ59_03270 [Chitinophagaceae bacterium]|nr:hypothetical protein [Chitinophagaceae bacterium]